MNENHDIIQAGKKSISVQKALKIINFKKITYKLFKNPKRNTKHFSVNKFDKKLNVESFEIDGFKVITVKSDSSSNKHIIFFHGGAYIIEASKAHRKIIETFALKYGFKVSFIDYPKAPENTFKKTHEVVLAAYKQITENYPDGEFILFGDSAGGGLALALLQVLRDENIKPFPVKTVLLSPWLDVTMSNELIQNYIDKDVILPVDGLIYAGNIYSGGENPKNHLISPIFGEMNNLGNILLFFGTNEVFYPDCKKLIDISESSTGTQIDYVVGEGMMHDWIVFPSEEANQTIEIISEFITD
ncbi:MAG: alpha/beta hydrolase [Bacteroidales bacterium]|nr:alpha/beta hydrolase [Bacteroidales bacterium]